jgi:putative transposase
MGAYYVTLCTYRKYPWFGEIVDGVMFPNLTGSIVQTIWNNLPSHFPFLELDVFVLMPNHLHGILVITDDTPKESLRDRHLSASPANSPNGTVSGSLGAIIQNFKSVSTRRINRVTGNRGTIWQRNYYEHIIRGDRSYENIRKYIIENPQRWHEDPENPNNPTNNPNKP